VATNTALRDKRMLKRKISTMAQCYLDLNLVIFTLAVIAKKKKKLAQSKRALEEFPCNCPRTCGACYQLAEQSV
jgi:hypothetical protein